MEHRYPLLRELPPILADILIHEEEPIRTKSCVYLPKDVFEVDQVVKNAMAQDEVI